MMKVSQLPLAKTTHVETTTDAHQILSNAFQLNNYIATYGDQEVEYDEKYKVYRVPAFSKQIADYSEMKARDCAIWGCE